MRNPDISNETELELKSARLHLIKVRELNRTFLLETQMNEMIEQIETLLGY